MKHVLAVIGNPSSGKSTFCHTIYKFFKNDLKRHVKICNLDPAYEANLLYEPDVNITDYVRVSSVMTSTSLGFNGALMAAMEIVDFDKMLLFEALEMFEDATIIILDCPGQVELYTCRDNMKNFFKKLTNNDYHVCSAFLVESTVFNDIGFFYGYTTNVTLAMLHLEVPHLTFLSKVDLLYNAQNDKKLPVSLDYYLRTDDESVTTLMGEMKLADKFKINSRYRYLTKALAQTISNYGLCRYIPFTIKDRNFLEYVLPMIDQGLLYINHPQSSNYHKFLDKDFIRCYIETKISECSKEDKA